MQMFLWSGTTEWRRHGQRHFGAAGSSFGAALTVAGVAGARVVNDGTG
jgi:hypothetical protein